MTFSRMHAAGPSFCPISDRLPNLENDVIGYRMCSSQAVEEVEGLSSSRCPRTALLAAPGRIFFVVRVCVTEYDRATSNYLEPLHARKVARAVERQLELIAEPLLKATSDLAPSCSATDSGPVEGKLGRYVVA